MLWYRLHQAPLRNPKQLAIDLVFRIHAEEPSVVLNLLLLGTHVRALRDRVLLYGYLRVVAIRLVAKNSL